MGRKKTLEGAKEASKKLAEPPKYDTAAGELRIDPPKHEAVKAEESKIEALERVRFERDQLQDENTQLRELVKQQQEGIEKLKNVLVQRALQEYDAVVAQAKQATSNPKQ